ncbi:M23/M56 family metallopeptidase [Asticcacaulis benevestitus]|uniref:Peptidase M23 domain-containing protein n=1 Tax=Asticcacaulis benevestitus DSM 16100 = ATCC BAA-896 TaxID=1121022 RepID=V4PQ86_9CAUL|nr:M23/M56 family metallopeptidase [Asticcacaulis benevestitus]ESQ90461.1 hypothetical protein ABENE_12120 [Asticcacaulis benevestitus DSM 16100 = ATCC BAA-896]
MSAIVTLMLLPLLWSIIVFVVRAAALRRRPILSDAAEKLLFALMLVPFVAGVLLLVLPVPAPQVMTHLLPQLPTFEPEITAPKAAQVHSFSSIGWTWPIVAQAIWGLGALVALFRLGRAHLRFARIAARATLLGNGVYQTQAVVPPFAWNRRRIVVPQSLSDAMTTDQFNLIVEHERAHQRRHDPLWFLVLGLVEAILWFNPALRLQARVCRLAAELACDAAVTQTAPEKRRIYAEILLRTITAAPGLPATIPALSDLATCKMRLETIMTRKTPPKALIALTTLLCLAVPAVGAELAFAQQPLAPVAADVPPANPISTPAFPTPVNGTPGAGFGLRKHPVHGEMAFHQGIDFIAPTGTPVNAVTGGTISFTGDRPGYGTVVEIDHADGKKTRYAHLSRVDVRTGNTVNAGQTIGAVGNSGNGTKTPHLHFEIWQGDNTVDPAPLLDVNLAASH